MLTLLLKLLLAHLIGDFALQTKTMVLRRKDNVGYLLLHILIHIALLVGFLWKDKEQYALVIATIAISHLAIDSLKIWMEEKFPRNPFLLFVIDQILHISIIFIVVIFSFGWDALPLQQISFEKVLLYSIAFVAITIVTPVILRLFFSKWQKESEFYNKKQDSLMHAGLWIGIIERLLIVLFILVDFWEGIGFLLAAKSIFRFGDLANAKDTKFTEYILVGTLASFMIAISIGYSLKLLLNII